MLFGLDVYYRDRETGKIGMCYSVYYCDDLDDAVYKAMCSWTDDDFVFIGYRLHDIACFQ